jgi:hypothetical protein
MQCLFQSARTVWFGSHSAETIFPVVMPPLFLFSIVFVVEVRIQQSNRITGFSQGSFPSSISNAVIDSRWRWRVIILKP